MKRRLAVVTSLAAIAVAASATPAAAGHACGAKNMSHGVGMANAMSHVAENGAKGNEGMADAVANAPC